MFWTMAVAQELVFQRLHSTHIENAAWSPPALAATCSGVLATTTALWFHSYGIERVASRKHILVPRRDSKFKTAITCREEKEHQQG